MKSMNRTGINTCCRKLRQTSISGAGFTLIETLVSVVILLVIMAAIFSQLNQVQQASSSEANKLDMTQQAREFVDQMVRDLHMAGYPGSDMYSPALPVDSPLVAAGLARVSSTEILLEGDVETSGSVYTVDIQYVPQDPNDPQCPCVRRSEAAKGAGGPLGQVLPGTKYTELQQVMPPGTGAGQSGEDLFTYFDQNGKPVNVGAGADISTAAGQTLIGSIETVKINLSLFSPGVDPETKLPKRFSLSVTGHLNKY